MSDDNSERHTKYGADPRLRHAETADLPLLSGHAHDQWDRRMPGEAISAEAALERASRREEIARHPHWLGEDQTDDPPVAVWLYRAVTVSGRVYTAVFLEEESPRGVISTVLRPARMSHEPMAAYLHAAAREGGTNRE